MAVLRLLTAWCAVVQFLLTPLLLLRGFIPALFSNLLYAVALSYYHYLSFLGYSSLPFLEHTEVGRGACAPKHVPEPRQLPVRNADMLLPVSSAARCIMGQALP